ncbi:MULTISPECIES: hypothetical protein [Leisingera]|uniref:hypothetical protein n=1 Tax=Leisingera TaxID=191028 RepID=UPI0003FD3B4B|nr:MULTISPECIES: hypothetical protein [Leisingera]
MTGFLELAGFYVYLAGFIGLWAVLLVLYIKTMFWFLRWMLVVMLTAAVASFPVFVALGVLETQFDWPKEITRRLSGIVYLIFMLCSVANISRRKRREHCKKILSNGEGAAGPHG